MRINKPLLITAILLTLSLFLPADRLDKDVDRGLASILPMDAYSYCKTLSSAQFAGRLTGHEGYTEAAKWAAEKFRQWKLKPINKEEGYLQSYPSPYTIIDEAELTLLLKEKEVALERETDFLPLLFSDKGDHTAELVFAGWGIHAPELGYDDYAGVEVKGKFILCFRGTPDPSDSRFEMYDHHRFRMKTAKEKGALGLFYIYPDPGANPNGGWIKDFTPAVMSEKAADMLLKEKGISSAELKKSLSTQKKPSSFPLSPQIRFKVKSRHFPDGVGYNVVGYVEGSDPELRKECLVIGGHFDHCGHHFGLLFAGANDNASGSAVVMEIAEAFSKLRKKPKRSVVFYNLL